MEQEPINKPAETYYQLWNEISIGDLNIKSSTENLSFIVKKAKEILDARGKIIPKYIG